MRGPTHTDDPLRGAKDAAAIALIGLLTAWSSRNNGFVWDDRAALVRNKDVNTLSNSTSPWRDIFAHDFWGTPIDSARSHKSYRPVAVLSFRWDHYWNGHDPHAFHRTNIVIHMLCCVLVWKITSVVLSKYEKAPTLWGARVAGLLFAVHPIHCDSVASIVGRADMLCVLFALAGYLAYNRAETRSSPIHVGAAIGLAILASLCKELGFTTFGIYIVHELLAAIAKEGDFHHAERQKRVLCVVVSVILLALIRLQINGTQTQAVFNSLANSINTEPRPLTRVLSYAHIHAWYLWKLVWPTWFSYDYGLKTIPVIRSVFDPRNLLTALAYTVVLGGFAVGLRNVRRPTLLLCIAFGVIPFVPASNLFFPVGTIVAERLLYFPSVGFCLLIGYVTDRFVDALATGEKEAERRSPMEWWLVSFKARRLATWLAGFVLFTGYWMSANRNLEWRDEETLFISALSIVPENVKVLNNVAKIQLNSDPTTALTVARVSIAIHSVQVEGRVNLGLAYTNLRQRLVALRHFMKSFSFSTKEPTAAGYTGMTLFEKWRAENPSATIEDIRRSPTVQSAIRFLDEAITRGTEQPVHYLTRGLISYSMRDISEAYRYFDAAVRANERILSARLDSELLMSMADLKNYVAICHRELGRTEEALELLQSTIQEYPGTSQLYFNAATFLLNKGETDKALMVLERCLRDCTNVEQMKAGVGLLKSLGQARAATVFLERAAALDQAK